jgi:hypothetical protein
VPRHLVEGGAVCRFVIGVVDPALDAVSVAVSNRLGDGAIAALPTVIGYGLLF